MIEMIKSKKHFFKILRIAAIILICMLSTSLFAKNKVRVAVLDISAKNVPIAYADIVKDIFEVSLHKSGVFKVLERQQMATILEEQRLQQSDCIDASCAIKIGKVLSANIVVVGSISKLGKYSFTIKLVDVAKGDIVMADSEKADTEDGIENAVNRLSRRIANH